MNPLEQFFNENLPEDADRWTQKEREIVRLAWNAALLVAGRIADSQKAEWVGELIRKELK